MRGRRLFWRLFLSYLCVTIVALALVAWHGSRFFRDFHENMVADDLQTRACFVQPEVADLIQRNEPAAIDRLCKSVGKTTETRITVVLPSGKVIGDTEQDPRQMDNHLNRPEVAEALSGRPGRSIRPSATVRQNLMYVAMPVLRDNAVLGAVRVSVPLASIDRTLQAIRLHFLVFGLGAAVVIAGVSLWLSRRVSRPLEELEAGAARLARGELDHRLQGSNIREIASLADAMNRMAEQWHERVQSILRQQDQQEAMLSSMVEGVLAVDDRGVILTLNASGAAILGVDAVAVRGHMIHEVIRRPDLLRFVEVALASDDAVQADLRISEPATRWLHAQAARLHDAENRRLGALIVLHDITELRRLESVRRDFVANVSHELRTPITSIKGFVETLLDGALDDKENAARFLEIIRRQVNRLDAIIADLLTLSRLERTGDEPAAESFSPEPIREMLDAAVEMCRNQAAQRGIAIETDCDAGLAAPMNPALMEQAVVNLLDNAIKYSPDGATVVIEAVQESESVLIRVRDRGCGIESRYLPRLFERFYRVDKARSRELGGTGLGLAIVKHIALVHGGSVAVESAVGRGSTFTIRLPNK